MKIKIGQKFAVVLVLGVFWFNTGSVALARTLSNLRSGIYGDKARLVMNYDTLPRYKVTVNGKQLVMEFNAEVEQKEKLRPKGTLIQTAALEPYEKKSRLIVNFSQPVPQYKVFTLKNPKRLVIDFTGPAAPIPAAKPQASWGAPVKLGEGLTYKETRVNMGAGNSSVYTLEIAPQSAFTLKPVPGYGGLIQKGVLSQIAKRSGAKAVVNACYFDAEIWVVGNLLIDGKWLGMERDPHTVLAMSRDKVSIYPNVAYVGRVVREDGQAFDITGLNRYRLANDLIYFNDGYDNTTDTNGYGWEVRVENGRASEISGKGSMPLRAGSFVLSGNGTAATFLQAIKLGSAVNVMQGLDNPDANAATSVAGAGPLLVMDGKMQVLADQEDIASDIAEGRSPRTAVGVRADGSVLVVVVDGRSSSSVGMTLNELAAYFVRLKAERAMNFDGGGSSEMVVNGRIVNAPSDGSERPVRVALGIFPK